MIFQHCIATQWTWLASLMKAGPASLRTFNANSPETVIDTKNRWNLFVKSSPKRISIILSLLFSQRQLSSPWLSWFVIWGTVWTNLDSFLQIRSLMQPNTLSVICSSMSIMVATWSTISTGWGGSLRTSSRVSITSFQLRQLCWSADCSCKGTSSSDSSEYRTLIGGMFGSVCVS